ncbi:MAG: hypothetical protein JSW64_12325 [Candidatus Zixiibacteriota bacterium]|nr:MAG: hypothetical protein JSW64_12325 [candidate division Zixibacteria bacterium]
MSGLRQKTFFIFLISLSLSLYACSLIGLGIGSAIDRHRRDSYSDLPGWDIRTIEQGTKIRLFLNDGDIVTGELLAIGNIDWSEYETKYEEYRGKVKGDIALPHIGENITAIDTAGKEWNIRYFGLDDKSILFKDDKQTEPRNIEFQRIERIISDSGDTAEIDKIVDLTYKYRIPSSTTVILRELDDYGRPLLAHYAYSKPLEVPLDQINQVQFKDKERGALTGFIVGAIVDIIVVAVILSADDEPPPRTVTEDTACGCPFIYSFDGDQYVLDSEAFGGSIFKAAERTDLDRLDDLKEVEGSCRLRITDQLQETDYIDEVKLLIIDRPFDIEIIPSFDGRLYSLYQLNAPIGAYDHENNDILNLVAERDDIFWTSNPFQGFGGESPARDGIELRFSRPANVEHVNFVFSVKNTVWAALMQSAYLRMHGNRIDDWYKLMNSSSEARDEVIEAFVREGMLLVYIWDGEDWTPSGFIWEIGTTVFRDQVLRVDISDIPGEDILMRLESTRGFWVVNSVHADFSPETEVDFTEIKPFLALDHIGSDRLELLNEADENYFIMNTGDWINLEFRLPEPVEGSKRTYVLKTSGYYMINSTSNDEPRVEMLDRFLREPGEFGKYSVDLFEKYYRGYRREAFPAGAR